MRKQSVFVTLATRRSPIMGSLFEVKLEDVGNSSPRPLHKPLAKFLQEHMDHSVSWSCCSLGSQLCLLPHITADHPAKSEALSGYHFNVNTLEWNVIKPPNPKCKATVVSAYGKIYSIVHPYYSIDTKEPSFERYDLENCSWKSLKAFPYALGHPEMNIKGYAVARGLILYNICYLNTTNSHTPRSGKDEYKIWAYDVNKDEWLKVKVEDPVCYSFIGSAISANDTVYGLNHRVEIMELSITRHQTTDEGHSVTCSLKSCAILSDYMVLERVSPNVVRLRSLNMVHLGDLNFCIIQFGSLRTAWFLKLTRIQLVGQAKTMEIKIGCSNIYEVPLEYGPYFEHCFTLDCKDIDKEEEIASPIDHKKSVDCHFKPEYDYIETDWREKERRNANDSSVHVQDEVGNPSASTIAEAIDLKIALKLLLRNSLTHKVLIRGLTDTSQAISDSDVEFCVLADDTDNYDYITALCKRFKVKLLTVPSAKILGDWCVRYKSDYEGEAKKVVCAAVKAFGEEEPNAVSVVQEHLKHVEPGKPCSVTCY